MTEENNNQEDNSLDNSTIPETDYSQFLDWIQCLYIDNISFRCIPERSDCKAEKSNKVKVLNSTNYNDNESLFAALTEINREGYAIYWQPQVFRQGSAEKYENLVKVRFLVADLDSDGLSKTKRIRASVLGCSCIVESSSGRTQAIWKVRDGSQGSYENGKALDIDKWKQCLEGIVDWAGGDKGACKLVQVFRVPGFLHQKGRAQLCILKYIPSPRKEYDLEQLLAIDEYKTVGDLVSEPIKDNESTQKVPVGSRHDSLLRMLQSSLSKGETVCEIEAIKAKALEIIRHDFEEGADWIVQDNAEIFRICSDALAYHSVNLERDKKQEEKIIEDLNKLTEDDEKALKDVVLSSVDSLKYTESAVAKYIVQHILGENILRVRESGEIKVWLPDKLEWETQNLGSNASISESSLGKIVAAQIYRIIRTPHFIQLARQDSKGNVSGSMKPVERAWATWESAGKLRAVTSLCALYVTQEVSEWDFDWQLEEQRGELCCGEGTGRVVVSLENGTHRLPEAKDLTGKGLSCFYIPSGAVGSGCPEWLEFLTQIFSLNQSAGDMIEFMQRLFGYSISGSINEQKIFLHYGSGANGKSKVLDMLREIIGMQGVARLNSSEFTKDKHGRLGGGGSGDVERIHIKAAGMRLGIIDDCDVGGVWSEGLVKNLTSQTAYGRQLYKETVCLRNHCKYHLGVNVLPRPEAENFGMLRRLVIIPYVRTFEPSGVEEDRLQRMIKRECSGVLLWAIEGWRKWKASGLKIPAECQAELAEYRKENCVVETTIKECIEMPQVPVSIEESKSKEWRDKGFKWVAMDTLYKIVSEQLAASGKADAINKRGFFMMLRKIWPTLQEGVRMRDKEGKQVRGLFVKMNSNLFEGEYL